MPIEQTTNAAAICLRPINDLLGESFFIPAYQRGYRWTEQQVLELLEDVLAFQSSDEWRNKDGFYCLQPIVVKQRQEGSGWEVVDGQQRLKTVYLILQYFNQRLAERFRKQIYTLDFESRGNSKAYLHELAADRAEENIDFHFMFRANQTIEDWFEDKPNLVNDFESALLNRVKLIWYQLPPTESAVDAFTRLNVGKIPLTNAELIRGLFLRSRNFPESVTLRQLKLAQEWDLIEKALQNDDLWYFLTDDKGGANRIDFIFDLITQAHQLEGEGRSSGHGSFHHFNDLLSAGRRSAEDLWNEVKHFFMTIEEWYRDQILFHLVGFLINEGDDVIELIELSKSSGKQVFENSLKQRIQRRLLSSTDAAERGEELREVLDEVVDDLEYGVNSRKIKSVLLLFNIASIIANHRSIVRFRFDYFKKENWDIEHIRSVDSSRPSANITRKPWLETVRGYFHETGENQDLRAKVDEMLSSRSYTTVEQFDELYDEILQRFEESESTEAENGIGNLALLDSQSNSSYKNAVFPIKRKLLLQYDQEGTFVPLCTRNAFLKCYSESVENMFFWGSEDQTDYRNAIAKILYQFFTN